MILVQERTNAGGRNILYVAMVNKINFDLPRERGEGRKGERDKGIVKEKERERKRV